MTKRQQLYERRRKELVRRMRRSVLLGIDCKPRFSWRRYRESGRALPGDPR